MLTVISGLDTISSGVPGEYVARIAAIGKPERTLWPNEAAHLQGVLAVKVCRNGERRSHVLREASLHHGSVAAAYRQNAPGAREEALSRSVRRRSDGPGRNRVMGRVAVDDRRAHFQSSLMEPVGTV